MQDVRITISTTNAIYVVMFQWRAYLLHYDLSECRKLPFCENYILEIKLSVTSSWSWDKQTLSNFQVMLKFPRLPSTCECESRSLQMNDLSKFAVEKTLQVTQSQLVCSHLKWQKFRLKESSMPGIELLQKFQRFIVVHASAMKTNFENPSIKIN